MFKFMEARSLGFQPGIPALLKGNWQPLQAKKPWAVTEQYLLTIFAAGRMKLTLKGEKKLRWLLHLRSNQEIQCLKRARNAEPQEPPA